MKSLMNYMDEELVLFFNPDTRNQAIKTLVDLVISVKKIPHGEAFYQAILEREKLVSTGIGMGVAIPHAKMAHFNDFFIAVGILQKGVEWQSLDHNQVRIIFLIGGPDDKQTEYLQILSKLTLLIKNPTIRKKMLTLNSKAAIIELFSNGLRGVA